ncbi:MAG: formylmethanofuran dehydrogenase subunit C [Gammaproteobacteria bacterium]
MSLELTLHTAPEVPLEAENISPDRVAGLSPAEIESLSVQHGNEQAAVGDFFNVEGTSNGTTRLHGDLTNVKYIGAGMSSGHLHVNGNVGAHLGAGMSGGEIVVTGNVGDWVAPDMSGGRIQIKGDAGHMIGSAYRGSTIGIQGGEIIVHGNARNEIGHGMRNGIIVIGGNSGDFTGVNMLAGTIIVLGELGNRSGAGMKRGTIISMHATELLPTFSYACTYQPAYLRIYLLYLQGLDLPLREEQISGAYQRWSGDAIELNRGEILLYKG